MSNTMWAGWRSERPGAATRPGPSRTYEVSAGGASGRSGQVIKDQCRACQGNDLLRSPAVCRLAAREQIARA
jgi:hypothetical protein